MIFDTELFISAALTDTREDDYEYFNNDNYESYDENNYSDKDEYLEYEHPSSFDCGDGEVWDD